MQYGDLQAVPFDLLVAVLSDFGIVESEHPDGDGLRIFRQMRMGIGTSDYLSVAHSGGSTPVPEPLIQHILDRFGVNHYEFAAACKSSTGFATE